MGYDEALAIVYQAIDVMNGQRLPEQRIAKDPNLILVGENGALDSLGWVTIVLAMERNIQENQGREVDLTGHEAFNGDIAAPQTASSIAHIILEQLS